MWSGTLLRFLNTRIDVVEICNLKHRDQQKTKKQQTNVYTVLPSYECVVRVVHTFRVCTPLLYMACICEASCMCAHVYHIPGTLISFNT